MAVSSSPCRPPRFQVFPSLSTPTGNRHFLRIAPSPSAPPTRLARHWEFLRRRSSESVRCSSSRRQSGQELEVERLFSNLNQATLKREPGKEANTNEILKSHFLDIKSEVRKKGILFLIMNLVLAWHCFSFLSPFFREPVECNFSCCRHYGNDQMINSCLRLLLKKKKLVFELKAIFWEFSRG